MKLRHIHAFERDFDMTVERIGKKLKITIADGQKIITNTLIKDGDKINVNL
ncbi:hypothetical protein [Flavobacterium sp.]|jgi:hypothetical protein|uniref:hypothetical protein n=1 Tax=Flavobacterium sp. TaxID=239 RepID=UPI0022C5B905|nr:hypothetical protein [Flavobacterium sp.]MCZ8228936.1 hypothetical protein [Flavobacterium sp.]